MRRIGLAAVFTLVLAGCGASSNPSRQPQWPEARCTQEAGWIAGHARQILRYLNHENGDVYPPDVAFIGFRDSLARFRQFGCRPALVGDALRRRLTPRQRVQFLAYLPPAIAQSVRAALAAR